MTEIRTQEITGTLSRTDVHEQWETAYRTDDNTAFYEEAFDYLIDVLDPPENALVLDAGCGIGAHSVRLANRGFTVKGIDFSAPVLQEAEHNVRAAGLEHKITFQREDLLSLSFADSTFDYAMCWGALMHIQEIDKAIAEVSRVLKPGGWFIVSEGNMHSLESVILRFMRTMLNRNGTALERTDTGLEYWIDTPAGALLTRQADIGGLESLLRRHGFTVRRRTAGQLTELYTRFSSRAAQRAFHALNAFWFRHVKLPSPAFGNILLLEKRVH